MWRRTTAFLLALALSPFPSLPIAAAQDDNREASPLIVTTVVSSGLGADCKSGEGRLVQFRYTGAQPLRGYLVRFAFADGANGKVLKEQDIEEIRDSREPMITHGAEWTRILCATPKKIPGAATVTANVDFLKFADGSTWGPAALRESHQLIGALDGMDFLGETTELERFVSPISPELGPLPVADVQTQTIGPLRIESGVWRDERGQDMLAVAITNESPTAIRGYLLTTAFFDPSTGARIRRFSTKELETHGNPADYLAPGSSWVADPRKFSYLSNGSLASYKIQVDLVVFADGSTFGPKKSPESDEVLGMLHGIDAANVASRAAAANEPQ